MAGSEDADALEDSLDVVLEDAPALEDPVVGTMEEGSAADPETCINPEAEGDTMLAASRTSCVLYPAFTRVCMVFSKDSPRASPLRMPPTISSFMLHQNGRSIIDQMDGFVERESHLLCKFCSGGSLCKFSVRRNDMFGLREFDEISQIFSAAVT